MDKIAFEILSHSVTYVEVLATLFGIISVYYATRENKLTWITGIISSIFLIILFYGVHLYASMTLQIYFIITCIYGWYNWKSEVFKQISYIGTKYLLVLMVMLLLSSAVIGSIVENIHLYLPKYFKTPAGYPFIDSFITLTGMTASVLLTMKKIESWYLWILVDILCIYVYFCSGVYLLSLKHLLFLILCIYGFYKWYNQLKNE